MVQGSAPQVVVAGSGVTGLTAALALAKAGARVTVCDPAPLGANASGVAAGMLAPAFEAALDPLASGHFDLLRQGRDLWPALAAQAGVVLEPSGALARGDAAWLAGVTARLADAGAAHEARSDGVFSPEDWRLEPAQALAALHAAARAAGVVFNRQALVGAASGEALLADGARLAADRIVLATGAARGLAPEQAALIPIKGHILRCPMTAPRGPSIRGEGVYLCPSGQALVVGATMEAGLDDTVVDPDKVAALRAAGARLLPVLERAEGAAQAGVRAGTADGLPLVGPSSAPGVILAVGLRRNGWLLAPLVGGIVAAYALGREPGPWAKAFDPRRFDL
jgi:glycine oxidase